MSDHDALLRAICESPRDDLPRLVYADWLEEHGQPERAAFIRADVAAAALPEWHPDRLRHEAGIDPNTLLKRPWAAAAFGGLPAGLRWSGTPLTRRGFPWSLAALYPHDLFDRGAAVTARYPVERIEFDNAPADLRRLAAGRWLAKLTGLRFRGGNYGPRVVTPFGNDPAAANLQELSFRTGALTPDGMTALAATPLFPNLTGLQLVDHVPWVARAFLETVGQSTPGSRLRALDLLGARLGDDGLRLLAASRSLSGLERLGLGYNYIDSARAVALAGSPVVANVRLLDLSGNHLGNEGTIALVRSPHLAELRVLHLAFCQVGDEGVEAILDSPLADRLALLNLTGSPASDEMKEVLKAKMGERVRV
jgi:uncharacterized protein (TIGR02996 family)